MKYIISYLVAIVLANMSVGYFGVNAVYINAFLFIGLDLTMRDKLHDLWQGKFLFAKMGLLIFTGSLISYLLNSSFSNIAIASFVAFMVSGVVDTVFYHLFRKQNKLVQVNGSNIPSALVDSIIFPTIAFGGFSLVVTVGQLLAKVLGGFLWSLLLNKREGYEKVK